MRRTVFLFLAAVGGCASTSPFQGLTPDQIYAYADEKYAEEEWQDAIAGYERLLATTPGYANAREARFKLATSFYRKGEHLSAVSEFVRILNRGGGDTLVARSALGVCNSYTARSPIPARDQTYTRQALTSCDEVVRDYGGTPEADSAGTIVVRLTEKLATKDLNTAEWYMKRSLIDSAINYFQDVVDSYPQTRQAPIALRRIYEAYTIIGYDDLAEQAREQLLRDYPESEAAKGVAVNGGGSG